MAILKESVIGVLSGKIGQVVGATWKGISVLKVLPGSIANPQTDAQLDQRQNSRSPCTSFSRSASSLKRVQKLCGKDDGHQCSDVFQHPQRGLRCLPQLRDRLSPTRLSHAVTLPRPSTRSQPRPLREQSNSTGRTTLAR